MNFSLRSAVLYSLLGLLLILLLAVSLVPPVARWAVVNWFEQQGLDATFNTMTLSLGRGHLELSGVSARAPEGPGVELDRLMLDIAITSLWESEVVIEAVELDGFRLDVVRTDDDLLIGGLSLNQLTANDTGNNTDGEVEVPSESPESDQPAIAENSAENTMQGAVDRALRLQHLSIANIEVCVSREQQSAIMADHCLQFDELSLPKGLQISSIQDFALAMPALSLTDVQVLDRKHELAVASISALELQALALSEGAASFEHAALVGLQVFERGQQQPEHEQLRFHGDLSRIDVSNLNWCPQALSLAAVDLNGLKLLLHRDEHTQMPVLALVNQLLAELPKGEVGEAESTEASQPETVQTEAISHDEQPIAIDIGRISLDGGSDLWIIDQGVAPWMQKGITDIQLQVGRLDNTDPALASEVSLRANMGEFGALAMQGQVWPFAETLNMQLEGDITALDMLPFSGYVQQAIGYQIDRGQLNNKLVLNIDKDILDARAELEFDKFEVKSLNAEQAQQMEAQSGKAQGDTMLPIGVALNLLRDSDGKIFLKLPVKGHIDDPSLSLNHVLGVVMRKAMTAAVMNYYAPFGLLDVASKLAKSATQLRFEPLLFTPGQAALDRDGLARMDQLSQLLSEKQQLSMSFCPTASGADALPLLGIKTPPEAGLVLTPEQSQQLRALAKERSLVVKSELLGRGVQAKQVILCQPQLELTRFDKAELTISL